MEQLLLMPVGFSRSGKTTLCKKIETRFPHRFLRVDSDSVRDYCDAHYPMFLNAPIGSDVFRVRHEAAKAVQHALAATFLHSGHSVILDACNQVRAIREEILASARVMNPAVVTVVIDIAIPESTLLEVISATKMLARQSGGDSTRRGSISTNRSKRCASSAPWTAKRTMYFGTIG